MVLLFGGPERPNVAAALAPDHDEGFDPEIVQMSTAVGCPPFGLRWGPIPKSRPSLFPRVGLDPVPHPLCAPRGSMYRASRTAALTPRCAEQRTGQPADRPAQREIEAREIRIVDRRCTVPLPGLSAPIKTPCAGPRAGARPYALAAILPNQHNAFGTDKNREAQTVGPEHGV